MTCQLYPSGAGESADTKPCPWASGPALHKCIGDAMWGPSPDILWVGEFPDADSDQANRAYESEAGMKLVEYLTYAGLDPRRLYLTYAARCAGYPGQKPPDTVYQRCLPYLNAVLRMRPWSVIIASGGWALKQVFPGTKWSASDVHGQPLLLDNGQIVFPLLSMRKAAVSAQAEEHVRRDLLRLRTLLDSGELGVRPDLPVYPTYGWAKGQFEPLVAQLQALENAEGLLAFDTETNGLDMYRRNARVETVAFSQAVGTGFAYAYHHDSAVWTSEEFAEIARLTRSVLSNPRSIKVGHNITFDALQAKRVLGCSLEGPWLDTMLSAYLLCGGLREGSLSLKAQVYQHDTGMGGYEDGLDKWKEQNWKPEWEEGDYGKIPLRMLSSYNAADVDATLRVLAAHIPELRKLNMMSLFAGHLMEEAKSLADMRDNGAVLAHAPLADLLVEFPWSIGESLTDIRSLETVRNWEVAQLEKKPKFEGLNPGSPQQVSDLLFRYLGLPAVDYTPNTRNLPDHLRTPTTDRHALAELQQRHPEHFDLLDGMIEYRKLTKLDSMLRGLHDHVSPDGLIHTNYGVAGTDTGRPNSTNPNLLNIPSRGALAKRVKSCFTTRFWKREYDTELNAYVRSAHGKLVTFDQSQIEPRVVAALSGDEFLVKLYAELDGDIHRANSTMLFDILYEEVTDEQRTIGKTLGLAILYGTQAKHLADLLTVAFRTMKINRRVTPEEAQDIINRYWARFPGVLKFKEACEREAMLTGRVVTAFNRIRYIPGADSDSPKKRAEAFRQATNTKVQSAASDIVLNQLGRLGTRFRRGDLKSKPVFTVYDSITFDCPDEEVEYVVDLGHRLLTDATPFPFLGRVPLKVDCEVHRTWGGCDQDLRKYPEPAPER